MRLVVSLFSGLIFGIGLIVSGMVNPAKVLGFLDITGRWDPSLAFVMMGAIAVGVIGFRIAEKRELSFSGDEIQLPEKNGINKRLIFGSLLFGLGWGVAGFCPGPAIVSVGTGAPKALVFVGAMLVGMAFFTVFERRGKQCKS